MAITRVGGSWIHKYVSLVADDVTHTYTRAAKPDLNLPNGSRCFEMDSDTEYIYDVENDAWEVYVPSGGGSGGTTNYNQLSNKPLINNVELSGNKTLAALGINAGSIGFDETETYTDGSVGKEVSVQKNAIDQNEESIADTQSMIATVEATTTASKNYAVGDLLVYDGKLYEVTSAIATGATIIVGSNVTQTTVEDQLGSGGSGNYELVADVTLENDIAHPSGVIAYLSRPATQFFIYVSILASTGTTTLVTQWFNDRNESIIPQETCTGMITTSPKYILMEGSIIADRMLMDVNMSTSSINRSFRALNTLNGNKSLSAFRISPYNATCPIPAGSMIKVYAK